MIAINRLTKMNVYENIAQENYTVTKLILKHYTTKKTFKCNKK